MQITRITVNVAKKINLGNYESKEFGIFMEALPDSSEKAHDVAAKIKQQIEEQLAKWEAQERKNGHSGNGERRNVPKIIETTVKDEGYVCPECGEKMLQKEGKEYFQCSKHWAYPRMIERGEVRVRGQAPPV